METAVAPTTPAAPSAPATPARRYGPEKLDN